MVAPVGLEPTRVAPMDFESIVSTIPPRSHNLLWYVVDKCNLTASRIRKKTDFAKKTYGKNPSVFPRDQNPFLPYFMSFNKTSLRISRPCSVMTDSG